MSGKPLKILLLGMAISSADLASPQPGDAPVVILGATGNGDIPGCLQVIDSFPQPKTVTFVVPPGDRHSYSYRVAFFGSGGTGLYPATPDQYGIIHADVGKQRIVDVVAQCRKAAQANTREEEPEQYFLVASNIDTGETFYTLDIPQVRLASLIMSLQGSINNTRPDREDRPTWFRKRMEVNNHNNTATRDIFLSLTGDMLTLDQVLDAIYVKTGCFADMTDGFIIIERC